MTCGIYLLKFNGTDRQYIGQSINIEKRFLTHISSMRSGTSSILLVEAYKTFGVPTYEVLTECTLEELDTEETLAIEIFNTAVTGLNVKTHSEGIGVRIRLSGEQAPNCTASNEEIIEAMRLLISTTKTIKEVAYTLNISENLVKDLACGNSHHWLSTKYPEEYTLMLSQIGSRNIGERNGFSKYTNETIKTMLLEIYNNPTTPFTKLAQQFNIPVETIKAIATGRNHKWLKEVMPVEYSIVISRVGSRSSIGRAASEVGKTYPNIISPSGTVYSVTNIRKFARDNNLNEGHLGQVLRGKESQHKGWKLVTE